MDIVIHFMSYNHDSKLTGLVMTSRSYGFISMIPYDTYGSL